MCSCLLWICLARFVWICALRFVWFCAIRFVWICVIRFVLHRLQERFRLCLRTLQATSRPPACRGCWSPPRSWCLARRTWAGWSGPSSTLLLQRRWQLQYDHHYINGDKMMFSHICNEDHHHYLMNDDACYWWWQDEFLTCLQCSHSKDKVVIIKIKIKNDDGEKTNFSHVCNVVIDGSALPYHCHLSDD